MTTMSRGRYEPIAHAVRLETHAVSHKGHVRANNEDSFAAVVEPNPARCLFAVADGLGGLEAGEVASRTAIRALTFRTHKPGARDPGWLDRTFHFAHDLVLRAAHRRPGRPGMGTTLTAAVLDGDQFNIGHAGDSALYHIDEAGVGRQVTENQHQPVEHNVLDSCLGVMPSAFRGTKLYRVPAHPGETLILASDGLTQYVSAATAGRMSAAMRPRPTLRSVVDALLQMALAAGGADNITIVGVRVLP